MAGSLRVATFYGLPGILMKRAAWVSMKIRRLWSGGIHVPINGKGYCYCRAGDRFSDVAVTGQSDTDT